MWYHLSLRFPGCLDSSDVLCLYLPFKSNNHDILESCFFRTFSNCPPPSCQYPPQNLTSPRCKLPNLKLSNSQDFFSQCYLFTPALSIVFENKTKTEKWYFQHSVPAWIRLILTVCNLLYLLFSTDRLGVQLSWY